MHFYIDEGGTFVPATGWGVVCLLAIPHRSIGPVRREINRIGQRWPRKGGELKGGLLSPAHLDELVEVLFRHDALLCAYAIDVSREDQQGVTDHKANQSAGITKYLVPEHHPNSVKQAWELRHTLERMPTQLYLQCVLLKELVWSATAEAINYFAQRRSRELAEFEWTIDAKDPRRITTYEKWWRDTLAPLFESLSRREPMPLCKDPAFDYRFLQRNFAMRKEMWSPDRPIETVDCYDIKKMITERMAFVDSRSETLIQTVDILASFLRPLLAGEIAGDQIAHALGRLQIIQKHGGKRQSLHVVTISRLPGGRTGLYKTIQVMPSAGRTMMKPKRQIGEAKAVTPRRSQPLV
jgi:hypothetical protein